MASSLITFFLLAALICCYAPISLSSTFVDQNPIRLVSDGLPYSNSAVFSIHDHILDNISPPIEALYQFGDSISDTGNFLRDNPSYNCGQLPYGQSYFSEPTGRCSDGLIIIDYFAKFFKLPLLDPYLNKNGNFTHGVNFAVGGAAALHGSTLANKYDVFTATNRSLSVQLGWFKSHLDSICFDASACKRKLSRALFFMGEIGGNDYNYAFTEGKSMSDVRKLVPEVVQTIKYAVEEVIGLGATRIVIPGNFPVGCMTIYLALFKTNDPNKYDDLGCLKDFNEFAEYHNEQVKQAIQELRTSHPSSTIMYSDYYAALTEILRNPASYGFDKNSIHNACCGNDNVDYNCDFGRQCGDVELPICEHPEEYVSWDGIHLTQHAYHVMANMLLKDILYSISNHVS